MKNIQVILFFSFFQLRIIFDFTFIQIYYLRSFTCYVSINLTWNKLVNTLSE